ncbi:hypothetical protein PMZ80_003913 [Knufia obscura]|uniref:C2H2-type domain-containing protein n=1 Tax=Knufia obscura TaxID=1635080 RepID=A0ABR0RWG9_9EURO|nr:hypothetical protein PMZ80_003913 [Knufia obscura]
MKVRAYAAILRVVKKYQQLTVGRPSIQPQVLANRLRELLHESVNTKSALQPTILPYHIHDEMDSQQIISASQNGASFSHVTREPPGRSSVTKEDYIYGCSKCPEARFRQCPENRTSQDGYTLAGHVRNAHPGERWEDLKVMYGFTHFTTLAETTEKCSKPTNTPAPTSTLDREARYAADGRRLIKTSDRQFACKLCPQFRFDRVRMVKKHVQTKHPGQSTEDLIEEKEKKERWKKAAINVGEKIHVKQIPIVQAGNSADLGQVEVPIDHGSRFTQDSTLAPEDNLVDPPAIEA